jgi:hypothetical protein
MSKIGESTWTGASGKKYGFVDYTLNTVFTDEIEGNYVFAKPGAVQNRIKAVYIGEGVLKDRIEFRIHQKEILDKQCDRVCVMINRDESLRKEIETDLLAANPDAYAPIGCNIKPGG